MSRLRGPPHRGVRRISPNLRPDDLPPPIHPITLARHDIPLGMLLPRRLLAARPLRIDGHPLVLAGQVGIAPLGGADAQAVLAAAAAAAGAG